MEFDIGLVEVSEVLVIGFNVCVNVLVCNVVNQKGVEICYYLIIYDLVDDIKVVVLGLLLVEVCENFIGYVEICEVFCVIGVGNVVGCLVIEGVVCCLVGVCLLCDNVVVYEGMLKMLKCYKDEVKEVQFGQECGMVFENYDDICKGDVIEIFECEEVQCQL